MGSPRSPTMMLAAVVAAASFACDVAVETGGEDGGAAAEASCEAEPFTQADADVPEESVTVRVSMLEGMARVDADTVRVRRGQSVHWASDRPFVVFFQRDAELGLPTDAKVYGGGAGEAAGAQQDGAAAGMDSAVAGMDTSVAAMDSATMQQGAAGAYQVRTPIRSDAACGVYEYALGVYDEATGTVVPLDPPLMVWP